MVDFVGHRALQPQGQPAQPVAAVDVQVDRLPGRVLFAKKPHLPGQQSDGADRPSCRSSRTSQLRARPLS